MAAVCPPTVERDRRACCHHHYHHRHHHWRKLPGRLRKTCIEHTTEHWPAADRCGRVQRNVGIAESRRNRPQLSMRHDDDDDDDDLYHYRLDDNTSELANASLRHSLGLTAPQDRYHIP